MSKKRYSELILIPSFEERLKYLQLFGSVCGDTFGNDRWINQRFYHQDPRWKEARREVIVRDNGCDLGIEGMDILGASVYVHHMNPLSLEDLYSENPDIWDPEFLICCSFKTHNAIHYGDKNSASLILPKERTPRDTCPWKEIRKEDKRWI